MTDDTPILLTVADDIALAEALAAVLEAEGIAVTLPEVESGVIVRSLAGPLPGLRVIVPSSRAEEARAILADFQAEKAELPSDIDS
jgi:hypothetical protein